MKKTATYLIIFTLAICLTNCSNSKKNLVQSKNESNIDLTNIDSICKHLNGFWVNDKKINSDSIIWIKMDEMSLGGEWEMIPFNEKIQNDKMIPVYQDPNSLDLISENNNVYIDFYDNKVTEWIDKNGSIVSEYKSKMIEIEFQSKNRFKINGKTYLRHKGYDFLK